MTTTNIRHLIGAIRILAPIVATTRSTTIYDRLRLLATSAQIPWNADIDTLFYNLGRPDSPANLVALNDEHYIAIGAFAEAVNTLCNNHTPPTSWDDS